MQAGGKMVLTSGVGLERKGTQLTLCRKVSKAAAGWLWVAGRGRSQRRLQGCVCVTKLKATVPADGSLTSIIQLWGLASDGKMELLGLLCRPDCGDLELRRCEVMVEGGLYAYPLGPSRSLWNVQGKMRKRSCLPLLAPGRSVQGAHLPDCRSPTRSTRILTCPPGRWRFAKTVDQLWPSPCSLCSTGKLDMTRKGCY